MLFPQDIDWPSKLSNLQMWLKIETTLVNNLYLVITGHAIWKPVLIPTVKKFKSPFAELSKMSPWNFIIYAASWYFLPIPNRFSKISKLCTDKRLFSLLLGDDFFGNYVGGGALKRESFSVTVMTAIERPDKQEKEGEDRARISIAIIAAVNQN